VPDCGCEHEEEFAALAELDEDEPDTKPDPRGDMLWRWSTLIAPYGKPTGDGRRFRLNSLTNRELPLPVKWQRVDDAGHKSSVVVATMDGIEYSDEGVSAWGVWLDPDPEQLPRLAEDVAEARLLSEKKAIGPSVDIDDMEYQPFGGDTAEMAVEGARPEVEVTRGRISAITLVQIPAFAEARPFTMEQISAADYAAQTAVTASGVRADYAGLPVAADATWDPLGWLMGSGEGALYEGSQGALFPVAAEVNGEMALIPGAVADAISTMAFHGHAVALPEGTKAALRFQLQQLAEVCELPTVPWYEEPVSTLVAGAMLPPPVPAALFENPNLTAPTPVRLEEVDGHIRVWGHLADWRTCHTGFGNTCIRAPKSRSNYAYFHVTPLKTDAGEIKTGKITLGGGHADTRLGFHAAAEHYDTTTTAVADVRVGEDKHGIWVSGVVRPYLGDRELHELSLAPLSGDWRPIGGSRELIAALAVNTPGFPVLTAAVGPDGEGALVAAGVLARDEEEDFNILDRLNHLHGRDGKFLKKVGGGTERFYGDKPGFHGEPGPDYKGPPTHDADPTPGYKTPPGYERGRLHGGGRSVAAQEDEGPTREENMRRMHELESRESGDEGLSGSEMRELERLRRLYGGRRNDSRRNEDDDFALSEEGLYFASLTEDARMAAAKKHQANPDGSYPIRNVDELGKAIDAYGRSKNKEQTKRLIMRRARELRRPDLIPDGWLKEREQMGVASLAREASALVLADTIEREFTQLRRLDAVKLADAF
jgi:hypothetical protein